MLAPEPTARPARSIATLAMLTPREREVLAGVSRGLTNKQIGLEFGISHRTVEVHRARLMRKLGARNLVELLEAARIAGGGAVVPEE